MELEAQCQGINNTYFITHNVIEPETFTALRLMCNHSSSTELMTQKDTVVPNIFGNQLQRIQGKTRSPNVTCIFQTNESNLCLLHL